DEATKALHPAAQREFFQILRTHCPQATVLAIMHTDGAASDFAYNKKLCFVDGGARMQDATPHPRMAQGQQPRTLHI
ncbi:MAG: hypothetical protein KJ667_07555, partial [Alphaproteobacteria bacterium]|nr:hypothetical protein [Alphaproteobacteria bacterium]